MKKAIVVFLTLVMLLTQLTSMTYPTETDSLSVSDDVTMSSSARSPYEKIHVYTHPDDENDYSLIRNEEELSTAIQALKSYTASLTPEKALQNEQSDIRITVEFESGFSETKEFITFRNRLSNAKSISEVREIRKQLNSFSKKYHADLIKSNVTLLDAMNYDVIDEIGYSPFVVLETSQNTLEKYDLIALAGNNMIMNIYLESVFISIDAGTGEEVDALTSLATSSDYGNEIAYDWDEMLECIGAKNTVDGGLFKGEGYVIGVWETGICDVNNQNLLGKDIVTITNASSTTPNYFLTTEHATNVTSIISLIAPETTIVCVRKKNGENSFTHFIDNNCDIVNISMSMNSQFEYLPSVDGYIDYMIYHHYIMVVKSSGNNGQNVTSPGKGYNVITVGGVTGTDSGAVIYDTNANYHVEDLIKPNLCGVYNLFIPNNAYQIGDEVLPSSGTSYAAPQVTACIVLLMEKFFVENGVWLSPPMVMSLILSGAEKTDDYTPINLGLIHFDRRVGAGVFNLHNCLYNSPFSTQLYVFDADQNEIVYQARVHLEAGETLQVALSLFVPMYKTFDENGEWVGTPNEFINYNLFLYSTSSQSSVAFSVVSDESNHELLRYTAYTSGDYFIQVKANEVQFNILQWLSLAYTID